jgi:hypothetical protein
MRTWWRGLATSAAALAWGLAVSPAWAQDEEGTTPGAIADPGTYQGSSQLQQQSDQQDQQFRQEQQASQPTYAPSAPSTSAPAYGSAPSGSSSGYYAAPRQAAPAAARGALVKFQVGASARGAFTPLAGVHLWVTAQDPVQALIAAGIQPIGSSLAQLTYDCQVAWVCVRDFKLMTARAVGVYTTDAQGHAQTATLQPGRYFVVGFAAIKGATVVWAGPVHAQPGVNTVPIEQSDGSEVAVAPQRPR